MKKFIFTLKSLAMGFLSLVVLGLNAQNESRDWCGTETYFQEQAALNPELLHQREVFEQNMYELLKDKKIKPGVSNNRTNHEPKYIIPLVVHIINGEGDCQDIISEEEIENAVTTLNNDFRMKNTDSDNTTDIFKPYRADLGIEFRLAKIDPNGNCTNGITRSYTDLTNSASDEVKAVSYWDATKYFNIWVVKSISAGSGQGTVLGRAQFPSWSGFPGRLSTFGFLVRADELAESNNRTATHEIGHCLALYHVHHEGTGRCTSNNCLSQGDNVCDTPQEDGQTFICDTGLNNCDDTGTGLDSGLPADPVNPIQNYMSYASCQTYFSLGQQFRVDTALKYSVELQNLFTQSNLIATGIDTSVTPQLCANFQINGCVRDICAGTSVSFQDLTSGQAPTSWSWDFGDGGTSTDENPTHTYDTPGLYTVSMTAGDGNDTDSKTLFELVNVLATSGGEAAPFYENFENVDFPTLADPVKQWLPENGNNNVKWEITDAASATGTYSYSINLKGMGVGYSYNLTSPPIDFSGANRTKLNYKYAYSPQYSGSEERIIIWASKDCGAKWTKVYETTASLINTSGTNTVGKDFVPTEEQWQEQEVDLTIFTGRPNILIRFEVISGSGNYFYIDDINVGGSENVGIAEESNVHMNVYPNPFTQDATIDLNVADGSDLEVSIYNVVGEQLYSNKKFYTAGRHKMKLSEMIPVTDSGVYFVKIKSEKGTVTKKMVKY